MSHIKSMFSNVKIWKTLDLIIRQLIEQLKIGLTSRWTSVVLSFHLDFETMRKPMLMSNYSIPKCDIFMCEFRHRMSLAPNKFELNAQCKNGSNMSKWQFISSTSKCCHNYEVVCPLILAKRLLVFLPSGLSVKVHVSSLFDWSVAFPLPILVAWICSMSMHLAFGKQSTVY